MIEIKTHGTRTTVTVNGIDIGGYVKEMDLHWTPQQLPEITLHTVDTEGLSAVLDNASITVKEG